jgi:hypothetical protein
MKRIMAPAARRNEKAAGESREAFIRRPSTVQQLLD